MAVYSSVKTKLDEQQSEERRSAYVLPIASLMVAVVGFIAYMQWELQFFLYMSAILFVIGIIAFIPALILRKKEQRSRQKSKPTRNQKIGWLLFGLGILSLGIGGPTIAITDVSTSVLFVILSMFMSMAFIIVGVKMAKW